jgi:heme-degrading monooxygenase HmoA
MPNFQPPFRRYSLFLLALAIMSSTLLSAPAIAAEKVLRHIVMYKFKDSVTPAQVQEVIEAFAGLSKKVSSIVGFEHGTNVSREGKSEGFTHVFAVTFKSEADLAAYLVHPAHDEYVKVVRDRREKVIVFDYWTDK